MGSRIEDAVWAPHAETVEIQDFLADHEHLFSRETANELAVIASPDSMLVAQALDGALQARIDPATGRRRQSTDRGVSLFRILDDLAGEQHPLDVVIFHDGRLRRDDADAEHFRRYRRMILPEGTDLTARQARALIRYLELGGGVTITGPIRVSGDPELAISVSSHARTRRAAGPRYGLTSRERQLSVSGAERVATNLHRLSNGIALHMIRYDMDVQSNVTRQTSGVKIAVRLPFDPRAATLFAPGAPAIGLTFQADERGIRVSLPSMGIYAIVAFES